MLGARDRLPAGERAAASGAICRRVLQMEPFARARRIALFASFRSEVDTGELIAGALERGKEVFLPVTDLEARRLRFYLIDSPDDLVPGAYGIPEPDPSGREAAALETLDLVVTPGAAFCADGGRIGYGGGYYDRVLAVTQQRAPSVGLAFERQIVDQVPAGEHDRRVDWIVTERRTIRARG